jgi:hypothetical protein
MQVQNAKTIFFAQLVVLLLFVGLYGLGTQYSFSALMPNVYPKHYERSGDWNNYSIDQSDTTFTVVTENKLLNWDAAIYDCIGKHLYEQGQNCYDAPRLIFYPGFPLFWRLSGLGTLGISILNFFLFGAATWLLSIAAKQRLSFFKTFLLFSLPGCVVLMMPYTESLFIFLGALSYYFYIKKQDLWSMLALFMMATVRPAAHLVLMGILVFMLAELINNRFKRADLSQLKWIIPFALAFVLQRFLLWFQADIPLGLSNPATQLWKDAWSVPATISGWTYESFSMSLLVLLAILIPALLFLFRLGGLALIQKCPTSTTRRQRALKVAGLYLSALAVYLFFQTQGSLHGLFRFALYSPAFLVLLIDFKPNKAALSLGLIVAFCLATFTLLSVAFAGDRWVPEFNGMPVLAASLLMLFYGVSKSTWSKLIFILLAIAGVLVNAHLYDMYLSNVWIWT